MPGIEDEDAVLKKFMRQQVGVLAGLAGLADQPRHDVGRPVKPLGAPPRHQRVEIGKELADRGLAEFELGGGDFGFQRAEDGKRPVAQRAAFMARDGQQVADHLDRDVLCEIGHRIDRRAGPVPGFKIGDETIDKAWTTLSMPAMARGDRAPAMARRTRV